MFDPRYDFGCCDKPRTIKKKGEGERVKTMNAENEVRAEREEKAVWVRLGDVVRIVRGSG